MTPDLTTDTDTSPAFFDVQAEKDGSTAQRMAIEQAMKGRSTTVLGNIDRLLSRLDGTNIES